MPLFQEVSITDLPDCLLAVKERLVRNLIFNQFRSLFRLYVKQPTGRKTLHFLEQFENFSQRQHVLFTRKPCFMQFLFSLKNDHLSFLFETHTGT